MTPKYPLALTNLPFLYQGKTRDTFATNSDECMLTVATKRLSTHNIVHTSLIEMKDQVLTMMTIFLMIDVLERAGIAHHLVAYGKKIYDYLPGKRSDYPADLHYRAIVVRKLSIIPIEFIFRAYLCGSLWTKYYSKGIPDPYGLNLPSGLRLMHRFDEPVFTPTDKSETDDERRSEEIESRYADAVAFARNVYGTLRAYLQMTGIELVDCKKECGYGPDGVLTLGDEISPDSCRFTNLCDIREGSDPPWRDKQIARDEAERIWALSAKGPLLFDPRVERRLTETYVDLFYQVTSCDLVQFRKERLD